MYVVQSFNREGQLLDLEECDSMDDAEQALDQMVLDGAVNVEVFDGSENLLLDFHIDHD